MPEVLAVPTFDFEVPFGSPNSPARGPFGFSWRQIRGTWDQRLQSTFILFSKTSTRARVATDPKAGGFTHFTVGDPLRRTGRQGTPAFCSGHPPAPAIPLTPRRRPFVQPPKGPFNRFGLGWVSLAPPHGPRLYQPETPSTPKSPEELPLPATSRPGTESDAIRPGCFFPTLD